MINVAGNEGMSSSVLPMLPRHSDAAPDSAYVGTQLVQQRRLDDLWPTFMGEGDQAFLKLDVQGYEHAVLRGAGGCLDRCRGIQMEVSFVPLYDQGLLLEEALDLAQHKYGMTLMGVVPGFTDRRTGQMLQCDLILLRE